MGDPTEQVDIHEKMSLGARRVLLPAPLPLFQGWLFLYDFTSFYKFTHINVWICNNEKIYKYDHWMNEIVKLYYLTFRLL